MQLMHVVISGFFRSRANGAYIIYPIAIVRNTIYHSFFANCFVTCSWPHTHVRIPLPCLCGGSLGPGNGFWDYVWDYVPSDVLRYEAGARVMISTYTFYNWRAATQCPRPSQRPEFSRWCHRRFHDFMHAAWNSRPGRPRN